MKKVVVNSGDGEIRAAILQNGMLLDIFIERTLHPRYAGNIYKGKVENVLPGMQAAFVDVGLERNVFLYVDDIIGAKDQEKKKPADDGTNVDFDEIPVVRDTKSIKDMLKAGQEIMVQVTKDPIGTKGARVVTDITLPGRFVVLMPTVDYVGISRRIEDEVERDRLKKIAQAAKPKKMGIIVRTVAEGRPEEEIAADIEFLNKLWKKIKSRGRRLAPPALIHQDYDLMYRMTRDYIDSDVEEIVVDDVDVYKKVVEVMSMMSNDMRDKVHIYKGKQQIFEYYGIEDDITKALRRKVWLQSGGYLVIDHTEALTVIDVNTGKFIGSTCLEDTVLQTNMEAAKEIARQVRLRNIGGIIVIDFIDMDEEANRKQVLAQLEEEVQTDKTKATVLGFTQLGLVEMTRKKVQQGLSETMTKVCPHCEGRGRVTSEETLAYKAIREIKKQALSIDEPAMLVHLNPLVASVLIGFGGSNLVNVEESTGKLLYVKGNAALKPEDVLVYAVGTKEEIERQSLPVKAKDVLSVLIEEQHMANSRNGIAREEGYVIDVEAAGKYVGMKVEIEITKVFKTYAKAKVVKVISDPLASYRVKDNKKQEHGGSGSGQNDKKTKQAKKPVVKSEPVIDTLVVETVKEVVSHEENKAPKKRYRNRRAKKNRPQTQNETSVVSNKDASSNNNPKASEGSANTTRKPTRKPGTQQTTKAVVAKDTNNQSESKEPTKAENTQAPKRRRRSRPRSNKKPANTSNNTSQQENKE